MKQIDLALHNYLQDYRCFPPTCVVDKNGKPLYSWRVLILPYIEQDTLYRQFHLDQPWDSPHNKSLLVKGAKLFRCPEDEKACGDGEATTNYLAVFGEHAFLKRDRPVLLTESPSMADSVCLIEKKNSGIPWTAPEDFCLDDLERTPAETVLLEDATPHRSELGYFYHERHTWFCVARADTSVRMIPADVLRAGKLAKLLQARGATDANMEAISGEHLPPSIYWEHCIGLPLWVVTLVLLLGQAIVGRHAAVKALAAEKEMEQVLQKETMDRRE
jgi:hypothetical protein